MCRFVRAPGGDVRYYVRWTDGAGGVIGNGTILEAFSSNEHRLDTSDVTLDQLTSGVSELLITVGGQLTRLGDISGSSVRYFKCISTVQY